MAHNIPVPQGERNFPLAQEIIDQIIDHVEGRQELAACALVCQNWVPQSRYHLFGILTLAPFHEENSHYLRTLKLLEDLDNPLCTFGSSMRFIMVLDAYGPLFEEQDLPRPFSALLPRLSKLRSVTKLMVKICNWNDWDRFLQETSFIRQITDLVLGYFVEFESFQSFSKTIRTFPSLEILTYDMSHSSEWNDEELLLESHPAESCSQLKKVEICCTLYSIQTKWCQLFWSFLLYIKVRLSTLYLGTIVIDHGDNNRPMVAAFSRYLQFIGPSLEFLQVEFATVPSNIESFLSRVDLACITELIELKTGTITVNDEHTLNMNIQSIQLMTFLSSLLRQQYLRTVIIQIAHSKLKLGQDYAETSKSDEAWGALDSLLSGDRFPLLKMVVLDRKVPEHLPGLATGIEKNMPLCKDRQLLRNYLPHEPTLDIGL